MKSDSQAQAIVEHMFSSDELSKWLGITIVRAEIGSCELRMRVRHEMVNGFLIAHGGISYSFADSALAFASNSHGRKCVSIETSISHLQTINVDDELTAIAIEKSISNKVGVYEVEIFNQDKKLVALFKGTVYRTSQEWKI